MQVLAKSKQEKRQREQEEQSARMQQERMAKSEGQLLKEIEKNQEGLHSHSNARKIEGQFWSFR